MYRQTKRNFPKWDRKDDRRRLHLYEVKLMMNQPRVDNSLTRPSTASGSLTRVDGSDNGGQNKNKVIKSKLWW